MGTEVWVVGLIVVGIASYATLRSLRQLRRAMASTGPRWRTTTGEILSSEVQRMGMGGGYDFRAKVRYKYSVNGEDYESTRVAFTDSVWKSPRRRRARNIVDKYPQGRRVTVHYHLDRPAESVLEPGVQPILLAHLLMGMAFVAVGAGVIWLGI